MMKKFLDLIANTSTSKKLSLLPQALEYGESGIDFLINCLRDSDLEYRAKAYNLLQNVESEKVKQVIASGLLLNPGDKIYSVYQAAIWFTDQSYLLFDSVNYLYELIKQVYGQKNYEEELEELACESQRVFCYLDQQEAKQIAEDSHRKSILRHGIGICGFYWERENPDFDPKQWCIDNGVLYKTKWDNLESFRILWEIEGLVQKSEDTTLMDKFKRSKYIYHLDFVDQWLEANQVEFSYQLDDWGSLNRLLEYLELPENVELLSKFWKDGVGHFAFVREEFVQQKAYVRIGKKIDSNSREESNALVAKPKNYKQQASDFLVKIINSPHSQPKHKLKAYELLPDFDTDIAKQTLSQGIEHISIDSILDMGELIELNAIKSSWDGNPF
ncbi:MAG: hypothetical protein AAGA16_03350 [Cyanobacteria bacterium P01_E01_bin.35]